MPHVLRCPIAGIKVSSWTIPFYGADWLSTQGDMIVLFDSEELEAEGPDLAGYWLQNSVNKQISEADSASNQQEKMWGQEELASTPGPE